MTKPAKLFANLLANPRQTVSFRDFTALLEAFGFKLDRTEGSHRQYIHPGVPRPFPVQPEGKDAKRYQVRQFMVLVERYELSATE